MPLKRRNYNRIDRIAIIFDDGLVVINDEPREINFADYGITPDPEWHSLQWFRDDGEGDLEYKDGTVDENFTDHRVIKPYIDAYLDDKRQENDRVNSPENMKLWLAAQVQKSITDSIRLGGEDIRVDRLLMDEFTELSLGERQDNEEIYLTDGSLKPVTNAQLRGIYRALQARKKRAKGKARQILLQINTGQLTSLGEVQRAWMETN